MQKFVNIALVLFGTFAVVHCSGYGRVGSGSSQYGLDLAQYVLSAGPKGPAGPQYGAGAGPQAVSGARYQVIFAPVPSVALGGNKNNAYAKGGNYGGNGPAAGQGPSQIFAQALGYAPNVGSGPISVSRSAYASNAGQGANGGYGNAGGNAGNVGYGAQGGQGGYGGIARPQVSIAQTITSELYPGRNNYRTYPSAPTYNRVALPVVASSPVAKVYRPRGGAGGYGAPNPGPVAAY